VTGRRIGTAAVHAGRLPVLPGDPVVAPVHRSVIYEFESAAEFGAIMDDERRGYLYSRIRNPNTDELAAVIAELEGAEAAHCFASGMGALSAAVAVLAPPGAGIVAAKQIYGQTHRLVALRPDGAHVDVADLEGLREAVKGRPSSSSRRSPTRTWRSPTCRRSARSRTPPAPASWSTTRSRRPSTAGRSSGAPTW